MSSPSFAVLAEDRDLARLRVALIAPGSPIELRNVGESFTLADLRHSLRGLTVIAVDADRLANSLVPQGFVALQPIDFFAFESLFGVEAQAGTCRRRIAFCNGPNLSPLRSSG